VACDTLFTLDDVDIETRHASPEVMQMFDKRPVRLDILPRIPFRRWLAIAFGTMLLALHAGSAWAGECTWTGGGVDRYWSTPDNWACTAGTVPQAGDALEFPTVSTPSFSVNDLAPNTPFTWLQFTGTHTIEVNSNAIAVTAFIESNGLGPAKINAPLIFTNPSGGHIAVLSGTLQLSGAITSNHGLTKTGPGSLRLSAPSPNILGGPVEVRHGELYLEASGTPSVPSGLIIGTDAGVQTSTQVRVIAADQIAGPVIVKQTGYLHLSNSDAIGALTLEGNGWVGGQAVLTLGGDVTVLDDARTFIKGLLSLGGATRTFNVGPSGDLNITGKILDGGLVKRGSGALGLTNSNTYSGSTLVEEGVLYINRGVLPGSVAVQGGVFLGTGTTGAINATGGELWPGNIFGTLATGSVTLAASSTVRVTLQRVADGEFSQLAVSGAVSLGGAALQFSFDPNWLTPAAGELAIIQNDGADPVVGTFAGLPEGALVKVGDTEWRISYQGGTGNDVTLAPTVLTYYLSEGATGSFFDFEIALANPNPDAAPVAIDYLREDGGNVTQSLTLPPQSRRTVRVDDVPGLDSTPVSAVVRSTDARLLLVERTMRWDGSGYGGHTGEAVLAPRTQWLFAEGHQGFFDTFLLLANSGQQSATATVSFLRQNGGPVTRVYTLAPRSRTTVYAGLIPELENQSFGITVVASAPIVAERAMYFSGPRPFEGGHESPGVNEPARSWFLAEGATGSYFDTFVLVANPNPSAAQVHFKYLLSSGQTVERDVTVGPNARQTVLVDAVDPLLANTSVSTVVTADRPVIVERAMYWPEGRWGEAHNSFGLTRTALRWGLAEGRVGGARGYETYILLANPSPTAAEVTVTFLPANGAPIVRTYTVAPTSRFNINVGGMVPELDGQSFGATVRVTNNVGIAVERAMYWHANGQAWAGGSNAAAVPLP
jgi:autotransporter-associated beta strand protein